MPEIESAEKRLGLHLACFTRTVVESKRNSPAPTVKTASKCESRASLNVRAVSGFTVQLTVAGSVAESSAAQGKGFLVSKVDIHDQRERQWVALERRPDGSLDLFTTMVLDITTPSGRLGS